MLSKRNNYPSRRSPSRHPACLTWGVWTRGGSSIWCSEQLRGTALAAPLQPLGSPSLPSGCLGPRGARGQGKREAWLLSVSCLPPPPRGWAGLPLRGCQRSGLQWARGGCGWQRPPPRQLPRRRWWLHPGLSPPPQTFLGWGLARSLPQMTGGVRKSQRVSDCFTTGEGKAVTGDSSSQGSPQGFMRRGKTVSHTSICSAHCPGAPHQPQPPKELPRAEFTLARPSALPIVVGPKILNHTTLLLIWGRGHYALLLGTEILYFQVVRKQGCDHMNGAWWPGSLY